MLLIFPNNGAFFSKKLDNALSSMISILVSFILLYILHKLLPNTITVGLNFKFYAIGWEVRCFSSQRYSHSIFLIIFTTVASSHVDSSIGEYLDRGADYSFATNQMVLSWRVCEIAACSSCDHKKRGKHSTRVFESRFAFGQVRFR